MGRSADDCNRQDAHPREITATEVVPSRKNKILLAIPETEYQVLQSHLEPFKFRQHCILHEPAQNLEFTYFPNRGLISLLVATEDGKTVEAGMVGNEGVIGVAAAVGLSMSPLRQVVQIIGDGFRIRIGAFQRCLTMTPHLQMALSRYAVVQGMQTAQTAACNRLHDVGERLARWLLMAADRVGCSSLPITHDFLATMLGPIAPVSVSRQRFCRGRKSSNTGAELCKFSTARNSKRPLASATRSSANSMAFSASPSRKAKVSDRAENSR
jgi:CRP-like cAMP-binding protein